MKTQIKQLLYGILATSCFGLSCTSLTLGPEEYQWPPKEGQPIVTLLGPVYETRRETQAPLFKALEQAMTAIVENQQTHLPEFYQQRIAGMNHQLFRSGYSNEEEWGSIKSLSSKAEDYDPESMAGILETSEYRKPGLEMAIRMQPTIDPQPASITLEGYRLILQPGGKGQAEWFTQVVKLKGRHPDDALRNALIWELVKPFEKIQKTFVLDDLDVPVWKDKITAGVLTFAKKEFTADAEPVRKETVEVCVQTRLCPEMNVKGDEFVLVSKIADAQTICRIFGRELIDKETLLRLSLTEEGSNLLEEENGAAWHSGGESGFFEENYNHLDLIPVIPSETAGRSQSAVVWCRSPVQDTFNFQERPFNFVMDRGWRTIKLYKSNGVGRRTLNRELVVEFLDNDELHPIVKHVRILESSFSDKANQGDILSSIGGWRRYETYFALERYTIDVNLSGIGWERTIPNVPVRRFGIDFISLLQPTGAISAHNVDEWYGLLRFRFGISSPELEENVINFSKTESVKGLGGSYLNFGFADYLKFIPNILWYVSMGGESMNFRVAGDTDSKVSHDLLLLDTRLLFKYKKVRFSLGLITNLSAQEESSSDETTTKVSIPAGSNLLMGIIYSFYD